MSVMIFIIRIEEFGAAGGGKGNSEVVASSILVSSTCAVCSEKVDGMNE